MATYGMDCDSSYSHRVGVQTSNNFDEGDDSLLSMYSTLTPIGFKNMASFKKSVTNCYNRFDAGSSDHHQFMAFSDVTPMWFNKIESIREASFALPRVTVLYDAREEVMIVKLISNPLHATATIQFNHFLYRKFLQLGVSWDILSVGNCLYGDVSDRCKEPDGGYKPDGRHVDDFPSIVLEVGISKPLQELKNDMRYWLTRSGGKTRVVIVLHVDKSARTILLERWECINSPHPHPGTVRYPPLIGMIQALELVEGAQYVGNALEIPAAKAFDIVPAHILAGEFVFTCNELQEFSELFWRCV